MGQPKGTKRRPSGSELDLPEVEKRIKQLLRGSLRQIWSRYSPDKQHALFLARTTEETDKRPKIKYSCSVCAKKFDSKEVQVDHTDPLGKTPEYNEWLEWSTWLTKLFCEFDRLSVMCKSCHQMKTNRERKDARDKAKLRKLRRKRSAA